MSQCSVYILGSGAAKPSPTRYPSSQILEMRDRRFLIDCGEGCQIRIRQMKLHTARLNHVFISHLHGDHCFGLIGLISTLGMDGRTNDLYIHAHPHFKVLMQPWLDFYCPDWPFKVVFEDVKPNAVQVAYEDKAVKVTAFPLRHRIPTSGYLFEEKPGDRHLLRDVCDAYQVPVALFNNIRNGDDFVTSDGIVIPNERLTAPPTPCKRYAYCTDTKYTETFLPIISGADMLYHDSTYDDAHEEHAKKYFHSTARQAATIAKLAGVKKLLLGHFSNRVASDGCSLKEAKEVFPMSFVAEDQQKYEI
ncbi:MAG: ribonuclease Z [Paludibacteraceae bacterium]|nr:ribonuclease Z [Paludibacteraceae bacterium]